MQKTIKQAYAVSKKIDLDFEDILQASSFGILYAISAFDETEHSSFPSYVPLAVNSQMRRDVYLHSNPVIDFPTYLMNDFFKIHTLVKEHDCSECAYSNNKLTCENLRNEIQDKLNSTAEEVNECIKYLQPLEDLWEDTCIDDSDITKGLRENEMRISVNQLLSHLKPQEEEVIRMHFGIDSEDTDGFLTNKHISTTEVFDNFLRGDIPVKSNFIDKNISQCINVLLNFGFTFLGF